MASCKKQQEPTIENINTIFQTKDFNIEFRMDEDHTYRLGFREGYVSFFSNAKTQRNVISYDEAIATNALIQNQFNQRTQDENDPEIAIYDDFNEVSFRASGFENELYNLLKELNLEYVPIKKK
ncbi:hypothetical protein [Nonlabens spongiae]|nr:hypothetical protein [Nonlabens spongiae]